MSKISNKTVNVGFVSIFAYWVYLFVVWGVFRLLFKLNSVGEELIVKPLVWGLPIVGWQLWSKKRVNIFKGNIIKAIGGGVLLGSSFAAVLFLANWLRAGVFFGQRVFGGMNSSEIVTLSLATAMVEESVFAGVVLLKLKQLTKSENWSIWLTTLIYMTIHIPIALFVYFYTGWGLIGFLTIVSLVAVSKYWLMMRTENVWAPIVAHWMWGILVWAIG